MLLSLNVPALVKEYLQSRFGCPVVLPKSASINIGVKIALCSAIELSEVKAHSDKGKKEMSLQIYNTLFNKKYPTIRVLSAQKEIIAQQLYQYTVEQLVMEIAIDACLNKTSVDGSIKKIIKRHELTGDLDMVRQIFMRKKKTFIPKIS